MKKDIITRIKKSNLQMATREFCRSTGLNFKYCYFGVLRNKVDIYIFLSKLDESESIEKRLDVIENFLSAVTISK